MIKLVKSTFYNELETKKKLCDFIINTEQLSMGPKCLEFESQFSKAIMIGILENTGNAFRIKDTALRQAQKTPDVKKLVQNLKDVKQIKCNHPVFNPGQDYQVLDGSLAIVIETREMNSQKHGGKNGAFETPSTTKAA